MDEDFLDLVDLAYLEGQIDGEAMVLPCIWMELNQSNVQ